MNKKFVTILVTGVLCIVGIIFYFVWRSQSVGQMNSSTNLSGQCTSPTGHTMTYAHAFELAKDSGNCGTNLIKKFDCGYEAGTAILVGIDSSSSFCSSACAVDIDSSEVYMLGPYCTGAVPSTREELESVPVLTPEILNKMKPLDSD